MSSGDIAKRSGAGPLADRRAPHGHGPALRDPASHGPVSHGPAVMRTRTWTWTWTWTWTAIA
eukprot:scaffold38148_cov40-Phaeocystis_antarctica.AAC.2